MSPTALSDEALGARALAGDRTAFTELFGRHESGLFNVAYRLTGSREDAADITQEAFLRVFARLDDLAGREVNLAAYLHRTARNLVYDRSGARESPTELMEVVAGADATMEADPELTTLVAAQGADVRAANARLPERHRLVLALRELEDMSYDDIGNVLDITPGAVGQLLARARLALRRELRLQHVDVEAMDPACRSRLGDIGAFIDGELGPDRSHVLSQHLELCPSCRDARASFEQARVTYRAWLPLPILGLGASTARAAEGRRLVRFGDATARRAAVLRRGAGFGGGTGGFLGGRRRAGAMVGSSVLGILLLLGAPTLVAVRSGSTSPPPSPPPPLAQASTAAGTTGPVTSIAITAPAPVASVPGARVAGSAAPPSPLNPATSPAPAPTVTVRGRAAPRPGAAPSPPVSVAGAPTTGAGAVTEALPGTTSVVPATTTVAPPTTTVAPPTTTIAPPTTTTTPPTRTDPPPTTRQTTPIDVPPGSF
jgi:RNA polymerase sigma-70 factor (ECF subfamily)